MKAIIVLAAALAAAGCSSIEHTSETSQPKGTALRAGPGDTIITVNQKKSLPNIFGRADLYGRTTPTGMVTVQYLGLEGSRARFVRNGVVIETGATTMNTSPIMIPNYQTTTTTGMVGNVAVQGTSTTVGSPTIVQPRPPQAQTLPQATVPFEVDLRQSKTFAVAGVTINILSATPGELIYDIR